MIGVLLIFLVVLLVVIIVINSKPKVTGPPVLILTNYNNEGGFFWQLYNVLNHLCVCQEHGFRPVVLFNTGLYFETRDEFTRSMIVRDKNNWFNHFFYPINQTNHDDSFWLRYLRRYKVPVYRHNTVAAPVMIFDRATLNSIPRSLPNYSKLWQQQMKVLPHIQEKTNRFKTINWQPVMIGMHFRGTDKFASTDSHEDNPVHVEYEFCYSLLQKHIGAAGFFIATDEQPLLDFLRGKKLPFCSTNSLRSTASTSGLFTTVSTSMCSKGNNQSEVCRTVNDLIDQSIHRGFPDASKYKKGEDVLIDVLLLASCSTVYRSRGNVSNFVGYMNPACKMIDMVQVYREQK